MRTILFVCLLLTTNILFGKEPIAPLPDLKIETDQLEKIQLGQRLFEDPILSKNGSVSCSSCHNLDQGGADSKMFSTGITGTQGESNTPSVFNSGFNFRQFWDGRAKNLEEQIDGPIQNSKEMGSDWKDVVQKIKNDKSYLYKFSKIYADGITPKNIKDAIATFEKTLVTSNSKFDRFLKGEKDILSKIEKRGYQNFKTFGCISCHQGVNIGGNMYQTMGVMGNYFKDRETPITNADLGRFNVTNDEQDKYVFRVPSLRNVQLTAPYFHDGSVEKLEDAVQVMAKYQLGRKLSEVEIQSLVAFLNSLTGEKPAILLKQKESGNFK